MKILIFLLFSTQMKINKISLITLLLISIAITVITSISFMGWILFICWWLFALVLLFHCIIHIYFLWNIDIYEKPIIKRVLISHAMLILLFLMRPESDDSNATYSVLLVIIGRFFKGLADPLWRLMNNNFSGYGNIYFIGYLILFALFIFVEIRFVRFTIRLKHQYN
jgi:hypothetical protein